MRAPAPRPKPALERLSTGWIQLVDKKALQIQKLEHILVARIAWIRAEYALERFPIRFHRKPALHSCIVAISRREPVATSLEIALERLSTGWSHPVDKKSLHIQKLEHILVAQIHSIRAEYALERFPIRFHRKPALHSCIVAISRREPVATSLEIAPILGTRSGSRLRTDSIRNPRDPVPCRGPSQPATFPPPELSLNIQYLPRQLRPLQRNRPSPPRHRNREIATVGVADE
jgi:hypothetical protein